MGYSYGMGSFWIHLVVQLFSPTFWALKNMRWEEDLYKYMVKMFYSRVEIKWVLNSWKEWAWIWEDGSQHSVEKYAKAEVTGYFHYRSCRDVSGKFILNTWSAQQDFKRAFIKLNLSHEQNFRNDGTEKDFYDQKALFVLWNRDDFYEIKQQVILPGFKQY